ncbi:MarR family winged helix-turn-helix transcriptional regulator [Nocardioides sp. MAHUQ-72]|uniref:MarR family winged helix-turn-helix transcriptional regulator n=1 Tax=unclassified Nocardioides TaxID=2615069 RepID=UPI0036089D68
MSEEHQPGRQIGAADGNLVLDLFVLHQRIGELMEATLGGTGVRPSEYAVLSQLGISPLTPRELTDRLGVTASTLTGHLAALRRRGHTRTTANPADGRSHRVELTESGAGILRECRDRFRRMLADLDQALGPDGGRARELLVRIDDAATEVTELVHRRESS